MTESLPVDVVKGVFAAFGRGDLPAILELLSDDIDWWVVGPPELIPHAGRRIGKQSVMGFFMAMGGIDFEHFTQTEWIAEGDAVVVVGHERIKVKATGRTAEFDLVMIFNVRDGKVARFRSFEDTQALVSAFSTH